MSKKKRNHLRASVDVSRYPHFFEVTAPRHYPRETFRLINISRRGFFLTGDCFIPNETEFQFSMQLSPDGPLIQGKAVVKWAREKTSRRGGPKGFGVQLLSIDPAVESVFYRYIEDCMMELKASDLATEEWLVVKPTDSLQHAIHVMSKGDLGAVMVLNPDESIAGIITERDVLRFISKQNLSEECVGPHMTSKVVAVDADQPADTVYQLFYKHTFRHLPVVQNGRFVGMLSLRDLLPYWSETMELYTRRITRENERAVSLIVHDLRSPIGTIKTANGLLIENPDDVSMYLNADCPKMVEQSCDKMLSLIDEILQISQIKVGETTISKQRIQLKDIVESGAKAFRIGASKKGISLTTEMPSEVPTIMADPTRIGQIVDNLVSNALKFSNPGAQVTLKVEVDADNVRLLVRDTGQGIPEKEIPKLFKEFSKLTPKPTAGERSTGLGLAITKKLVAAHGGEISVDSKEGAGTTFTVQLPRVA